MNSKELLAAIDPSTVADSTFQMGSTINNLTLLEYDVTPPKLPVDFQVADIAYRGDMKWASFIIRKVSGENDWDRLTYYENSASLLNIKYRRKYQWIG